MLFDVQISLRQEAYVSRLDPSDWSTSIREISRFHFVRFLLTSFIPVNVESHVVGPSLYPSNRPNVTTYRAPLGVKELVSKCNTLKK